MDNMNIDEIINYVSTRPQTVDNLYDKRLKLNGIGLFNASVITFSLFWRI